MKFVGSYAYVDFHHRTRACPSYNKRNRKTKFLFLNHLLPGTRPVNPYANSLIISSGNSVASAISSKDIFPNFNKWTAVFLLYFVLLRNAHS